MEQVDNPQGVDTYTPESSSPMLRRLMWITVTIMGLVMAAVLLSQPRATTYIQSGLDRVEGMMASFRTDKNQPQPTVDIGATAQTSDVTSQKQVAVDEAKGSQKPAVSGMPTSRIPVNRFKVYLEN